MQNGAPLERQGLLPPPPHTPPLQPRGSARSSGVQGGVILGLNAAEEVKAKVIAALNRPRVAAAFGAQPLTPGLGGLLVKAQAAGTLDATVKAMGPGILASSAKAEAEADASAAKEEEGATVAEEEEAAVAEEGEAAVAEEEAAVKEAAVAEEAATTAAAANAAARVWAAEASLAAFEARAIAAEAMLAQAQAQAQAQEQEQRDTRAAPRDDEKSAAALYASPIEGWRESESVDGAIAGAKAETTAEAQTATDRASGRIGLGSLVAENQQKSAAQTRDPSPPSPVPPVAPSHARPTEHSSATAARAVSDASPQSLGGLPPALAGATAPEHKHQDLQQRIGDKHSGDTSEETASEGSGLVDVVFTEQRCGLVFDVLEGYSEDSGLPVVTEATAAAAALGVRPGFVLVRLAAAGISVAMRPGTDFCRVIQSAGRPVTLTFRPSVSLPDAIGWKQATGATAVAPRPRARGRLSVIVGGGSGDATPRPPLTPKAAGRLAGLLGSKGSGRGGSGGSGGSDGAAGAEGSREDSPGDSPGDVAKPRAKGSLTLIMAADDDAATSFVSAPVSAAASAAVRPPRAPVGFGGVVAAAQPAAQELSHDGDSVDEDEVATLSAVSRPFASETMALFGRYKVAHRGAEPNVKASFKAAPSLRAAIAELSRASAEHINFDVSGMPPEEDEGEGSEVGRTSSAARAAAAAAAKSQEAAAFFESAAVEQTSGDALAASVTPSAAQLRSNSASPERSPQPSPPRSPRPPSQLLLRAAAARPGRATSVAAATAAVAAAVAARRIGSSVPASNTPVILRRAVRRSSSAASISASVPASSAASSAPATSSAAAVPSFSAAAARLSALRAKGRDGAGGGASGGERRVGVEGVAARLAELEAMWQAKPARASRRSEEDCGDDCGASAARAAAATATRKSALQAATDRRGVQFRETVGYEPDHSPAPLPASGSAPGVVTGGSAVLLAAAHRGVTRVMAREQARGPGRRQDGITPRNSASSASGPSLQAPLDPSPREDSRESLNFSPGFDRSLVEHSDCGLEERDRLSEGAVLDEYTAPRWGSDVALANASVVAGLRATTAQLAAKLGALTREIDAEAALAGLGGAGGAGGRKSFVAEASESLAAKLRHQLASLENALADAAYKDDRAVEGGYEDGDRGGARREWGDQGGGGDPWRALETPGARSSMTVRFYADSGAYEGACEEAEPTPTPPAPVVDPLEALERQRTWDEAMMGMREDDARGAESVGDGGVARGFGNGGNGSYGGFGGDGGEGLAVVFEEQPNDENLLAVQAEAAAVLDAQDAEAAAAATAAAEMEAAAAARVEAVAAASEATLTGAAAVGRERLKSFMDEVFTPLTTALGTELAATKPAQVNVHTILFDVVLGRHESRLRHALQICRKKSQSMMARDWRHRVQRLLSCRADTRLLPCSLASPVIQAVRARPVQGQVIGAPRKRIGSEGPQSAAQAEGRRGLPGQGACQPPRRAHGPRQGQVRGRERRPCLRRQDGQGQ